MHPQAANPGADFENFRRKVEAGADGALTQLFYNADAYFDFMERCAKAGITIPVTPGIMPITGFANTCASAPAAAPTCRAGCACAWKSCRTTSPRCWTSAWRWSTRLCETLLANGAPGLHFYTVNQAGPTLRLWKRLGLPMVG
jgi:methylenetetrahydrofolate reductase (NADPH)